jgi:hypothetical protein
MGGYVETFDMPTGNPNSTLAAETLQRSAKWIESLCKCSSASGFVPMILQFGPVDSMLRIDFALYCPALLPLILEDIRMVTSSSRPIIVIVEGVFHFPAHKILC